MRVLSLALLLAGLCVPCSAADPDPLIAVLQRYAAPTAPAATPAEGRLAQAESDLSMLARGPCRTRFRWAVHNMLVGFVHPETGRMVEFQPATGIRATIEGTLHVKETITQQTAFARILVSP